MTKLSGQMETAGRSQTFVGAIGLVFVVAILLPWVVLAVGCILAGIVAIQRGERALVVCLPAGLALLVAPALLFWLDSRWYPRISGFVHDDDVLRYTLSRDSTSVTRPTDDVRWVTPRMHRGRTRGHLVKFRDGSGIFVCRSIPHADELAQALKEAANKRPKA
jgi:hypothetical protein